MNDQNSGIYQGARYYKCALQVNPYSYNQYRGEETLEESSYNQNILQQCLDNHIEVVGLANHADIRDSENLRILLNKTPPPTVSDFQY